MSPSPAQEQPGAALSGPASEKRSWKRSHCRLSDSGPGQDSLAQLDLRNVIPGVGAFILKLVLSQKEDLLIFPRKC